MHCELRSDCETSQSAFSNSSQPTSFKTNHAHDIHGNRPVIPVIKSTHTRFKIKVLYFGKLGCFMIYRDLGLPSLPWLHSAALQMNFHALCAWKYCLTQLRFLVVTPTVFSASRNIGIKLLRVSTLVLSVDRYSIPGPLWEETTC